MDGMEILEQNRNNTQTIEDVVDQHAESLMRGEDTTAKVAEQYEGAFPALGGLLNIASRLQSTLVPVQPEERFVSDLYKRLDKVHSRRIRSANRLDNWRVRVGKVNRPLGVIVSVLAVIALAAQVIGSIMMVVVIITGNNRRRRTAASA